MDGELTITICMGSSCHSRGNGRTIEAIQSCLAKQGRAAEVKLVGHLCEDQCKTGPNIEINGKRYPQADAATIVALISAAK